VNRWRIFVGEMLLKLAFRILEVDRSAPASAASDDEVDYDGASPIPVKMNDRAREMIRQGMRSEEPTRQPVQPTYLKGSLAERYAAERARSR
jgi:hypothetical protein